MSTITGSIFIKSGADNTVVLLGADGTKLISEFTITIDNSNYVKKDGDVQDIQGILRKTTLDQPYPEVTDNDYIKLVAVKVNSFHLSITVLSMVIQLQRNSLNHEVQISNETYSRTELDNKYVIWEGSIQQTITGRLKYVSIFGGTYDGTQDPVENIYLTQSEVDAKLTNYVNTTNNQSINRTKTFKTNVNATGFVKTGKDDTSVLLAGGGDRLLSSFDGIEYKTLTAFRVQDDVAVITHIPFPNHTVDKGSYIITHQREEPVMQTVIERETLQMTGMSIQLLMEQNQCHSNLGLLFEATDEFEDALTTPRNTASRRLNPHIDLTSFMITLQCEHNSNGVLIFDGLDTQNQNVSVELREAPIYQGNIDCYYNVDLMGRRQPPPILCPIHDTFWLFGPANGGSSVYDVNNTFDEVISQIEG
ncbi:MAG: hypothetical protein EZS28_006316 [Streblomastix strix]|uniref:Uncharacterized protein n=1 Tax=Streblomastix strix TaxID=222440 RepID=A0A5J4WT68_9EUKA|nr:MAG: hypothetical protein EZS28_006316 [Streblomastix strix]